MEWRIYICTASLLLLLWLGPYVFILFPNGDKVPPDTSASDRRLIRLCLRGLVLIAGVALLCWWLG